MTGLVVDPATYSRAVGWEAGKMLCADFLKLNGLRPVQFVDMSSRPRFRQGPGAFGYYRSGMVRVNVARTALPQRGKPIRAWSYSGWKSDRTAPGVTAHEVGHHVDQELQEPSSSVQLDRVTGYSAVHPEEAWAEAVRVFILNPDLLRSLFPRSYKALVDCGLRPIVDLTWQQVLVHAHPRYHELALKNTKPFDSKHVYHSGGRI